MDFVQHNSISKGAEIVSVKVPGLLLNPFLKSSIKELEEEDPMIAMLLKKLKSLKVMTISNDKKGLLMKDFNKYLAKNKFEEMASIHSEGSVVSINGKMKGDRIKRLMLGIADEDELVFLDIKSDLDLNELAQMISYYEQKQEKQKQEKM
ncbi:hypothetical protein HMPREF0766_13294 [Sphingobacterium spiritivorum ATCC 33861]|uniref:DUF4252 domain-containing protein n=2 Tax=Sphingobacterium spiritivorum TaxID=258 RepID=D7VQP0_SPHSI|nr:hypothetical protein HMPREF0766_13294 [Sphingobacterium spiritivorum ATCC 33861]